MSLWLPPLLWSLLVVVPVRIPSPAEDTGEPQPVEPVPVQVIGLTPAPPPPPPPVPTKLVTVVLVTPACDDPASERRLRIAALQYLATVDGLPYDIAFDVKPCAERGMVDIEIIEVPRL